MRRVANIILGLLGYYLLYKLTAYFLGIFPIGVGEGEHLCETVGDVYIIYLVITIAFFFFFYVVMMFGEFTNIHKKIDKIGKKLESIEAAIQKQSDVKIEDESQDLSKTGK